VLLDEPDSHLNSNLQHAFVDILEELARLRNFQVLMATHSKEIINYVDPSRLIPIDRKAPKAEALKRETSTVTILKELGAIDNVDAYQIVKQRSILIVEGSTDRELIPRLAAKTGITLFDGSSRASILPANGVDRLSDGNALNFVEHLLGNKVKALLVRDRDGLTRDWMEEVRSKSNRPMFIWPRDCLESYLIVSSAIHQILCEELGEAKAPKLNEAEDLISTSIEKMFDLSQDRIAARFQDAEWRFNHNRIDAAKANPVARSEMEEVWKKDGNPLAFAPGKELLSRIRDEIQKRWNVSFGNARIIEAMSQDDVHQDVKNMFAGAIKTLA
jgi:predicted ATP-dependent endonuclease of OLD family